MSRLLISAAHKSSGKTTISIGLCAALRDKQVVVQPFKKGPDYIDPMWLGIASSRPCYNLDFYTQSDQEILDLVTLKEQQANISLIEGNKGLYDGLDLEGANSNAALAKLLNAPVVLVIDTRGMTRGVAPLLMGYQVFDKDILIAGVIFNQVGGSRHESKLRAAVEHYTDIPVLGAVRRYGDMNIDERHLGLVPSNEAEGAEDIVANIARHVRDDVDLERLLSVARDADHVEPPPVPKVASGERVRIAIARDAAFGFYYADDLEAFAQAGAELVPFNATKDARLPENIHGLFIGGGFPESCMAELSANVSLRSEIRNQIEAGLPTYAECGGLMYLAESIRWDEQQAAMVGVVPGQIRMHFKPQGRGYIRVQASAHHPWMANQRSELCGHEFHHSSVSGLPDEAQFGYEVKRGAGIDGQHDGYIAHNLVASYAHLRNTRQSPWVPAFVDFVRKINFPARSTA